MQHTQSLRVMLLTLSLLATSVVHAKLIIRGGASTGIGGGVDGIYLAPAGTPNLISDPSIPIFLGSPTVFTTQAVPYENRPSIDVAPELRCSPAVCEYRFNANDPLSLLGVGDNFAAAFGVTASYEWTLFTPTVILRDQSGNQIGIEKGSKVTSFAATGVEATGLGYKNVSLDMLFPVNLPLGSYEVALTSIYQAPSGSEFGLFDPDLFIGGSNGVQYPYNSLGGQFVFDSQRYSLTLVNTPAGLSLFLLLLMTLVLQRKTLMRSNK